MCLLIAALTAPLAAPCFHPGTDPLASALAASPVVDAVEGSWSDKLHFGGYGELHFNSQEGPGGEQLDLHRLVFYLGWDFADWIVMHSETELEHAFIKDIDGDDVGDGEIKVEQWYFDFLFSDSFNLRAGRYLQPLGMVNQRHEPPLFFGVERSLFDTTVIPTTWFSDGIGAFGALSETLNWELYLGSSLDGSRIDDVGGIRPGRQEERPGMNAPAVSGRLAWQAHADWAIGVSGFHGGLNNGDEGTLPGVDADLSIACLDVDGRVGRFELRAAGAVEFIDGAESIGGDVGERIDGFMAQVAHRVMPDGWRQGRLSEADAALFVRYDWVDTQAELPAGATENPAARRDEITVGASFWPVSDVVFKVDYQWRDDDTGDGLPERFNMGLGWSF